MADSYTEDFFTWIKGESISLEYLAKELNNTASTLKNWKSLGIPVGKRAACAMFKERHQQNKDSQEIFNQVSLKLNDDDFNDFNQMALEKGMLIQDLLFALVKDSNKEWKRRGDAYLKKVDDEIPLNKEDE